jgi:general secretion pathway protein L
VRSAYRKLAVASLAIAEIVKDAPTTMPDGATASPEPTASNGRVAEAIKSAVAMAMVSERGGSGDGIAVALDGSRATVRTLTLPASVHKQLNEVLPFELESVMPFEMETSLFDYRVLDRRHGDDAQMLTVIAAIAPIEDVRARIALTKEALGVEPERVGVGAFPFANLLPHIPQLSSDEPVVILDLGTRSSEILILKSGEPVFARTLSFGTLGLPATAPRLAREIRVTLAAYRSAGGSSPTHVYLCGGGAYVSGAQTFLASELDLEVEGLPIPSIDLTAIPAEQMAQLPLFAKALGLALGLSNRALGLDLRRGPLAYERGFAWFREKIPLVAGLGAVILVSLMFSAWAQLYSASKEQATLEKALGTVTKDVLGEDTTSAARANELLGQLTALNDEDPLAHADAFDVMVRLSEEIPQSMVHDIEELDVQKGHVVVHGVVGSVADAQSIAASLKEEKCFSDVKIARTNQMIGTERQKYVLEFDIKCPEDQRGSAKKSNASASGSASGAP